MTSRAESAEVAVRPMVSVVVCGLAGLAGGFGGAGAGMRIASALVEPAVDLDPLNLFGNALLMIGPLLVIAVGALLGFVVGSTLAPLVVTVTLKWGRSASTLGFIVALNVLSIPLLIWLVLVADGRSAEGGSAALWVAAGLVGGLVPGLARWLAVRSPT